MFPVAWFVQLGRGLKSTLSVSVCPVSCVLYLVSCVLCAVWPLATAFVAYHSSKKQDAHLRNTEQVGKSVVVTFLTSRSLQASNLNFSDGTLVLFCIRLAPMLLQLVVL